MIDKVIALFAEILLVHPEELCSATSPADLNQWDSLANMMLIAAIEETFGVELSTAELDSMKSIGDVQKVLQERNVT